MNMNIHTNLGDRFVQLYLAADEGIKNKVTFLEFKIAGLNF